MMLNEQFMIITRAIDGFTGDDVAREQTELVNLAHVQRIFPREGGGAYLTLEGDSLQVRESFDALAQAIQQRMYAAPF
jgi:hypothetical protein